MNVIGLLTNGVSFYRILRSFNVRKSVYFLMMLDSLMSLLCSLCYGLVFFISVIVKVPSPWIFCLLFMALPYINMLLGFVFAALIAAIR